MRKFTHCRNGDAGRTLHWKAEDAGADAGKRHSRKDVGLRNLQGATIATCEQCCFVIRAAAPDGTDRVNNETRRQSISFRQLRLECG